MTGAYQRPPVLYRPRCGNTRSRVFTTPMAASDYEDGWRRPEQYTPNHMGLPAQVGAYDRMMEIETWTPAA